MPRTSKPSIFAAERTLSTLRSNLVSTDLEGALQGFDSSGKGMEKGEAEKKTARKKGLPDPNEFLWITEEPSSLSAQKVERDLSCQKEYLEGAAYSPIAVLEKRDLSHFERGDIQVAQLILKQMMSPFRVAPSRQLDGPENPGDIHFASS
jgi:hypothetical protein